MVNSLVASFESKTRGKVDIFRGYNEIIVDEIYRHSGDDGIRRTLGTKDLRRFAPEKFPSWVNKGGGRFMYTAWSKGSLAGLFWIGGETFPSEHFPHSPLRPPYTAAWRTAYSSPEGGTYEGEGIGKRIALAGIADVVALTRDGGPVKDNGGSKTPLPPLADAGLWIDTGIENTDGQVLYHHLGNTSRTQEQIGFTDIGVFEPPFKEGATELDLEPRVGMVADKMAIGRFIAAGAILLDYEVV